MITLDEFKSNIKRNKEKRVYKIKDSLDLRKIYRGLNKEKWYGNKAGITITQFQRIISSVNLLLAESLLEGHTINFPYRMGKIVIIKRKPSDTIDEQGKLKTSRAIDWDKTIKLWYEDEKAHKDKILVRCMDKERFYINYDKRKASYNNNMFFEFRANRSLKNKLKERIESTGIDAMDMISYTNH